MPPLEPLETLIKLDVVEVIVVTFRQEQLVFWLRLQPHAAGQETIQPTSYAV